MKEEKKIKKEKVKHLVEEKMKFMEDVVDSLSKKEKVLFSINGKSINNLKLEADFQKKRLDNMKKFKDKTVEEIETEIKKLSCDVVKSCKYGSLRFLPENIVKKICLVEDLELILGIHPNI